MKTAIAAILTSAVGLFVASMLGTAVAEAPTGTPLRTMSVQGIGNVAIGQTDNAAAATAVYREGMAAALTDGRSKAEFLAGKVGATLGSVQSVVEDGGSISCRGETESGYAQYEGEQPDFGTALTPYAEHSVPVPAAAPRTRPSRLPKAKSRRKKAKRPLAKKAAAVSCTLTAEVSLVYTIS